MEHNLIVPGGAIIVDNSLMKVNHLWCLWRWCPFSYMLTFKTVDVH